MLVSAVPTLRNSCRSPWPALNSRNRWGPSSAQRNLRWLHKRPRWREEVLGGKVRRTVLAHVQPWKMHQEWSSRLRIFPRTGRTRLGNPSLLGVETGLVCPSEPHSISLSLFLTMPTQRGGLFPCPIVQEGRSAFIR